MALTSIDFSQIENIDNTPTGININKAISFNQQLAISTVPPQQEGLSNIWFNKSTNELKIKINNFIYDLKPSETLNSISIGTNTTFNLNGKRGIVNNFTITGSNTIITVRGGNSNDWSILEVQGNLTIPTGCTLNLIRTPIIVRGSILGGGIITSPDGANGGTGGVGGPGGDGGTAGITGGSASQPGGNGFDAPSTWPNQNGSSLSMPIEYNISSGNGGPGGRGTGGGGGGGSLYRIQGAPGVIGYSGGSSGSGNNSSFSGGSGAQRVLAPTQGPQSINVSISSGGGGGAGGAGTPASAGPAAGDFIPPTPGGPGATGATGSSGLSAGILSTSYIGIGTPSNSSSGSPGTFGGAGGNGYRFISNVTYELASPGSTGGQGGSGGPGGSTGGAHLTVFCIGDISSSITFRPGRGGINGGILTEPKAQTGSLWLFNKYGTTSPTTPGNYDIAGIGPDPSGPSGVVNRILITDTTSVNSFFRDILYNSNGLTPAKDTIILTL